MIEDNLDPNPRIIEMMIGIRTLRTVTIYPLSVGHQIKTAEIVGLLIGLIVQNMEDEDFSVSAALEAYSEMIHTKLSEILTFVTDPKDKVTVDDLDNSQLADFLNIVFAVNYGDVAKKFQTIWDQAKVLFPSPKSSPKSLGKQAIN